MSVHQLREIFKHAGLEFSLDSQHLLELKKIILLHLKASPTGTLEISGETYTKNEILKIFLDEYTEDSFDIKDFLVKHVDVQPLTHPESINRSFPDKTHGLTSKKSWFEVQAYFTEHHYLAYFRTVRDDIKIKQLLLATQKASYLFLFDDEIQLKFKKSIKTEILSLIKSQVDSRKGLEFTLWDAYYQLLKIIGDDDIDFLLEQHNLIITQLNGFTPLQIDRFFVAQLGLNFDEYVKEQIRREHERFSAANAQRSTYYHAREDQKISLPKQDSEAGQFLVYIILAFAALIFFLTQCDDDTEKVDPLIHQYQNLRNLDYEEFDYDPNVMTLDSLKKMMDKTQDYSEFDNKTMVVEYDEEAVTRQIDSLMKIFNDDMKNAGSDSDKAYEALQAGDYDYLDSVYSTGFNDSVNIESINNYEEDIDTLH